MNDDRIEARMLLERAMDGEPTIGMDTENLLNRARHSVRQRRAATIGAVAAGVTVVAVASLTINPSRGAPVVGAAPSTTTTVPPGCGAIRPGTLPTLRIPLTTGFPSTVVTPPTTFIPTAISTSPKTSVPGTPGTVVDTPVKPPWCNPPIFDETTMRLTKALAGAKVFPAGVELLVDSFTQAGPLVFRKVSADDDSPLAAAWLQDGKGKVRLTVMVFNRDMHGYDVVKCEPPAQGLTCTKRTLPDESAATLYKAPGASEGEMMVTFRVLRPNGSLLEVIFSNVGDGMPGEFRLTREGLPMTDDEIFKIGEITGLAM
jgi:hypothetical protein